MSQANYSGFSKLSIVVPPSLPEEPVLAQATNRALASRLPPIEFPAELPVSGKRAAIAAAIAAHQVVIVCGETGSGKTTQLPKICLTLGRGLGAGGKGLIGHTQPRRLAASATARRIAQELQTPLGEVVGYKVRFTDKLSRSTSIKLMTDGILLAETQSDPLLRAYDTLIIDEAHERSLNIDFLLGYLKEILPRRPDLKLIITSATLDAERFAKHFSHAGMNAPVIEVSGRLYPVEIRYRPVQEELRRGAEVPARKTPATESDKLETGGAAGRDLTAAIVDAVDELAREGSGDVLVFLPGEREIRDAAQALRQHHPPHTEILPLFARLSMTEQERIFKVGNARRIVLATNVAETSLTVPGIRYVIDTGVARVKRYSYRNKVEQLRIEPISQAAAQQRAGRCGRVADGICIRLYDETDWQLRPRFTDPEILRSSLAAVILKMKSLHLAEVEQFPFLEPPPAKAIADGYQLLAELGAVDSAHQLTSVGQTLAQLPLDPRIGRMILAAHEQHALREMLIIASALSVQDPRDRPLEQQSAADAAHRKFADPKSEFLSFLKIWQWFDEALTHKKSNRQLLDLCRANFLSHLRLREWREVHSQLLTVVGQQSWRINQENATFEQIHLSLLSGLLGNLGFKAESEPHYLGARSIKFHLWPGSHLVKKAGRWMMAAELVETSRLFARTLAVIEPTWVERAGAHLLRRSIGEPHWEKKAAQVVAFERATLYGLTVYHRRRISFGKQTAQAAQQARDIFIRAALVEGEFETKLPFFKHNRQLIAEIEQLEHRSRRQDILIDDELIYAFYNQAIPADIYTGADFEHWYRQALHGKQVKNEKLLFLNRDDLMRHEAAGVTTELFPKKLTLAGIEMAVSYHFEPGSPRDGVTLAVPIFALNQVDAQGCEWLVAGMLKEKVHLLLKSLPQKLRRHCIPLPAYAADFVERATFGMGALIGALSADIRAQKQLILHPTDFKLETLPAHLCMNFKVIDEYGRQLAAGRNLAQLRAELGAQAQQSFQQIAVKTITGATTEKVNAENNPAVQKSVAPTVHYKNLTHWSFGSLPEIMEIERNGETLMGYPALVDRGTVCDLELFDLPQKAARVHRAGLRRLFTLQLRDAIRFIEKNLPNFQQMAMQYMPLGVADELRAQIITCALERACLREPLPIDATTFAVRCDEGRSRFTLLAQEISRLAAQIFTLYTTVAKKLASVKSFAAAHTDMTQQLHALMGKYFLTDTPYEQLVHFPRYLQAIALRSDKLKNDAVRDARLLAEFSPLQVRYARTLAQRRQSADAVDPQLQAFRWLLEELRVALFAQELRTPMPVSIKRLNTVWESIER